MTDRTTHTPTVDAASSRLRLVASRAILPALLLCAASTAALADPVTFTFASRDSGTIGATSFTDAAITVVETADTADITSFGAQAWTLTAQHSTIDIAGVGSFTFLTSLRTFINNGSYGFGRSEGLSADLFDSGYLFPGYDLSTSISGGGTGAIQQWEAAFGVVLTDGGVVQLDVSEDSRFTFTAAVTPVPESDTYALLAAGLGVIGILRRRRVPAAP